jgi:hypothetical protein
LAANKRNEILKVKEAKRIKEMQQIEEEAAVLAA